MTSPDRTQLELNLPTDCGCSISPPSFASGLNDPSEFRVPKCSTLRAPAPPGTGCAWHAVQLVCVNTGPKPWLSSHTLLNTISPLLNSWVSSDVRFAIGPPNVVCAFRAGILDGQKPIAATIISTAIQ